MNLLDAIEKLINERGSAAVMKERIELFRDQAEVVQAEVELLRREKEAHLQEIDDLRAEVESLEKELLRHGPTPEFVTKNGILWRPDEDGFEGYPYCPKCETVMHKFPPGGRLAQWVCGGCKCSYPMAGPPKLSTAGQ